MDSHVIADLTDSLLRPRGKRLERNPEKEKKREEHIRYLYP